jgi:hypothetical protein
MKFVLSAIIAIVTIALVIVTAVAFRIPLTTAHVPEQLHQEIFCKDTTIDEQLATLPEFIKSNFISGGGNVYLTDKSIADILIDYNGIEYSEAGRAAGVFIVNAGTPEIWLICPSALLHEFGHYFDWSHLWLSGSGEFLEVYHAEKDSFHRHIDRELHYISTPAEYFAESFARYIMNPDTLEKHCPDTYYYLSERIYQAPAIRALSVMDSLVG